MAQNAHNPAYEGELPAVERQRTFGAAAESAKPAKSASKYGGKPPEKAPAMTDFFKRTQATPEEEEAMAADRAAPEPEAEEPEVTTAEETPAPEEPAAEEPTEAEEPESRRVPLGELMAEREKRKGLQAKIEQMEAAFQRVIDRVGQPQQPAPAPQQPAAPAYESDPVGNLAYRMQQLETQGQGFNQHVTQQQQLTQFQNALGALESQFRAATPDYDQAVMFARNQRAKVLEAMGYDAAQSNAIITQEIIGASASAMNRGQNPAELFYNLAKTQGWAAPAAPKPVQPPAAAPATRLAAVAKGQQAARAPRGGTAPAATVTLTDLAGMDDSDFDANFNKLWRRT